MNIMRGVFASKRKNPEVKGSFMEQWDILTRDGKKTGRTVSRGAPIFRRGEYHLVVHIWLVDDKGNLLIQRRSDDKPLMPGEWAAIGGSALAGESSRSAAKRELAEEMSIEKEEDELQLVKRLVRRNSLLDIYIAHTGAHVSDLTLQAEEVAEARWVSSDDLCRLIESGKFHNYGKEYFDVVLPAVAKRSTKRI